MTEQTHEPAPGDMVLWGTNGETGKVIAVSHNGKTAFIQMGWNAVTGKPRYITVATQKLRVAQDDRESNSTV